MEVTFDEYAGRKSDGTLNSNWSGKPATMIKKVALVQALREAFPNDLNNLYTEEEQGDIEVPYIPETPVEQPTEQKQEVVDVDYGESLV